MKNSILVIIFLTLNIFVFGQQDILTSNQDTAKNKLISIKIKGTDIDVLPSSIDIITFDIYKTAKGYISNNDINIDTSELNKTDGVNFFSFTNHKIPYFFSTPELWVDWFPFENKDVLYTFSQEEVSELEKFAIKYKLKKIKNIDSNDNNDIVVLYSASPNYYVMLVVKKSFYQCVMHPEVTSKAEGVCSICGMELIHIDSH